MYVCRSIFPLQLHQIHLALCWHSLPCKTTVHSWAVLVVSLVRMKPWCFRGRKSRNPLAVKPAQWYTSRKKKKPIHTLAGNQINPQSMGFDYFCLKLSLRKKNLHNAKNIHTAFILWRKYNLLSKTLPAFHCQSLTNMCRVKETITKSRSLQIERNHSTLQDNSPPPPYYSFHETPGDIVHTLLTAFTPLLFLCYPYPSLQQSSPGGNTQKSYICKGCQCWLLHNCWKAKEPSPALQLGWFKLLPEGPAPPWPTRQARYLTQVCCITRGTRRLFTALFCLITITLTGRLIATFRHHLKF